MGGAAPPFAGFGIATAAAITWLLLRIIGYATAPGDKIAGLVKFRDPDFRETPQKKGKLSGWPRKTEGLTGFKVCRTRLR